MVLEARRDRDSFRIDAAMRHLSFVEQMERLCSVMSLEDLARDQVI
jgi:hypothetical protein